MEQLKIVASITIKEEYKNEVVDVLHTVVEETRKEEGNVSYDLHIDVKNPLKYIIIEAWQSDKAIELHNGSKHFQAFVKSIEGKVEELAVDTIKFVY